MILGFSLLFRFCEFSLILFLESHEHGGIRRLSPLTVHVFVGFWHELKVQYVVVKVMVLAYLCEFVLKS